VTLQTLGLFLQRFSHHATEAVKDILNCREEVNPERFKHLKKLTPQLRLLNKSQSSLKNRYLTEDGLFVRITPFGAHSTTVADKGH
jgi:hypothetical protein